MITTTWKVPFDTTRQMQPEFMLSRFLPYLLAQKSSQTSEDFTRPTISQGLTDEEVEHKKSIAEALRFLISDALVVCGRSITGLSQEIEELWDTEKTMLALIGPRPNEVLEGTAAESEMLDWEMVSTPRKRETRTLSVSLHYAGRGKPIPDPDPWT
jgi:hypothetical protein